VQIMRHFESERLGTAVQAYATAQRCVDLTVAWVKARGLDEKQVVRHKLAEMARRTDVAREYLRVVARWWAFGDADRADAAMAKNTAVEACDYVVYEAVQLHGGLGYMRESEVERHYRDARILDGRVYALHTPWGVNAALFAPAQPALFGASEVGQRRCWPNRSSVRAQASFAASSR
jgi:hypothetical protein